MGTRQGLQRRTACISAEREGRKVTFNHSMKLQLKKDVFLSNIQNKQRFLDLLGEHLAMHGSEIANATGDADVSIVQRE